MTQDINSVDTDYFCLIDIKETNIFQCFTSFMKSFIVQFFRHTRRLIKARQVNSYIILAILWCKSKFAFYLDITNVSIIFMQICYIEVFDLTNPIYNERISSVPW